MPQPPVPIISKKALLIWVASKTATMTPTRKMIRIHRVRVWHSEGGALWINMRKPMKWHTPSRTTICDSRWSLIQIQRVAKRYWARGRRMLRLQLGLMTSDLVKTTVLIKAISLHSPLLMANKVQMWAGETCLTIICRSQRSLPLRRCPDNNIIRLVIDRYNSS